MKFARTSHGKIHVIRDNPKIAICGQRVKVPMEIEDEGDSMGWSYHRNFQCGRCWRKADVTYVPPQDEGHWVIGNDLPQ